MHLKNSSLYTSLQAFSLGASAYNLQNEVSENGIQIDQSRLGQDMKQYTAIYNKLCKGVQTCVSILPETSTNFRECLQAYEEFKTENDVNQDFENNFEQVTKGDELCTKMKRCVDTFKGDLEFHGNWIKKQKENIKYIGQQAEAKGQLEMTKIVQLYWPKKEELRSNK